MLDGNGRFPRRDGRPAKNKTGQSTLEMVVIFGGALLVLIAILAAIPGETAPAQSLRQHQAAADTVAAVAQAANDVYLAGEGAQKTIWVELPDGFDAGRSFVGARTGVSDWGQRRLVDIYTLQTGDVFEISRGPICGAWPAQPGRYQVVVAYNGSSTAHVTVNGAC